MEARKILSENLLKYREKNNLSQELLAFESNISTRQMCKIENCQCNPSLRTLDKLSLGTGLSVSELLSQNCGKKSGGG